MMKTRLTSVVGSDKRMDIRDVNYLLDTPINKYMVRCDACLFPEIDLIPQPYFIMKKRCFSGVEIHPADLGNIFVSTRLKMILETVLPGECNFHKTYYENENIATPWWLAEIKNKLTTGEVKSSVNRCSKCGHPLHAHPGSQYQFWHHDVEAEYDIVKSENWMSLSEKDWKISWIGRDCFLSNRLLQLLNKVKIKGVYKNYHSKIKGFTPEERTWVDDKLKIINSSLLKPINTDISDAKMVWFNKFMEQQLNFNETKKQKTIIHNIKIPDSVEIKALTNIVSPICVDREDGIFIQPPDQWEVNVGLDKNSRRKLVSFVFDKYGNSWAFDANKRESTVYYYNHEAMEYETMYNNLIDFLLAYLGT